MNEINEAIAQYGQWVYLLIFLWAALEGETFVIFAGFAAHLGYLSLEGLILSAWLGSSFGDQVFFWLGRYFGIPILTRFSKLKPSVEKVLGWLERYPIPFILSYRFTYGIRNVSSIAAGMSNLTWQKFGFWNLVAALIWSVAFSGFGYFFGDAVAHLSEKENAVDLGVQGIMLAILGLLLSFLAVRAIIMHVQKRYFS